MTKEKGVWTHKEFFGVCMIGLLGGAIFGYLVAPANKTDYIYKYTTPEGYPISIEKTNWTPPIDAAQFTIHVSNDTYTVYFWLYEDFWNQGTIRWTYSKVVWG